MAARARTIASRGEGALGFDVVGEIPAGDYLTATRSWGSCDVSNGTQMRIAC